MKSLRFLTALLLFIIVHNTKAQNDCAAYPKTGKFDTLTYIKSSIPTDASKGSGLWLGQGTILRNGVEVRPAFIPSNHPEWAIAIAVAWNYTRNTINRVEYPQIGYWLATVVQETELGCVAGTTWDAPYKASKNMANANTIMGHDGCFQIEGPGSAYGQLSQNYPLGRFPLNLHQPLIEGPTNFETSAMVKSYFDVYTTSVYNNYVGWDVYESIDCTIDPYAYIKTSASGYNGGINAFANNASKFTGSLDGNNCWGGFAATTANYANDVAKWVSVLENNPSYCEYPAGSSFDSYYNGDMTWTMVNNYINSIKIMYPDVNWTAVTAKVQATFNSMAVAGKIKFQQLGDVVDAIVINLPKDYPQTVEGSPVGVNIFGCSGKKVPYGHFEIVNGAQTTCIGESVTLNIVVDAGGGPAPTFRWFKTSAPNVTLAATQTYTISPTVVGTETYGAELCNAEGCYRLNANECSACVDPRNLCGVQIHAKKCSNCTFAAAATSTNTPCKGTPGGKIDLTLTNTPANYKVSYVAITPVGSQSADLGTASGNSFTINNIRDGSYNITLTDVNDPSCKAKTTVIVGYTNNTNYYIDGDITSTANCVANLKAEIKELPAPCNWKVRVHVPVFFQWENPVNFGVTTSSGLSNLDRYTRTAPRPEIDAWNDAQIFESVFSLNTGDKMTFELALTNTPGATQWRDYEVNVFDENNVKVYTKNIPAQSAKADIPFTVGDYTVTCPATIPNYTFTWSPSITGQTNTSKTSIGNVPVDKLLDKSYTVTAIDPNAPLCPLKEIIVVPKDPSCNTLACTKPSATISGGATFCAGDSAQLSVALAGTQPFKIKYTDGTTKFYKSGITASPYTFYVKNAGTYKIDSVWDATCDTAGKGSAVVVVSPKPTLTISGDTTICLGETAQISLALVGTAPFNITATVGATVIPFTTNLTSYIVPLNVAGTYFIKVTDAKGCSVTKKVSIIINPLPTLDLGADKAMCSGASVTLDAGAIFSSYAWTKTKTGNAKTIVADLPGEYKLTVTDANGCKISDSLNVTQGTAVAIDFGGATKTICAGSSVSLAPSVTGGDGNYTYKWSNAGSGTAATYNASAAGFYTVEITDGKGCKDIESAEVVVSANLTVTLANKAICAGDSIVINSGYSGAGYTFLWSNGDTAATIVAKTAATYTVDVANGTCAGSGSMILTVNALPVANLGADKNVCATATATLDAGVFASWLWTTGETTQTISKGAGNYGVTVTDVNGCKDVDSIVVNSIAKPNPNVILDVATCAGGNVTFDVSSFDNGNGPYSYKWNDNSTLATLSLSNLNSPSVHYVDVTDKFGCVGRDSARITIQASLGVQITGTPDTVMCAGSSITLTSNYNAAGGYNLSWSTGSSADNISVNSAGLITLTVDDGNGCAGTDAMNIVVNASPDMTLVPANASVCSGDAASIGYNYGAGYTYLWTPGNAASAIYSTFTGGTYNVKVTNSKGCFADTNVVVNAFSKPLVDIVANVDACLGETITLQDNSGQTSVSYEWTKTSTGASVIASTPTLQITTSDTYKLKVIDANTCFNSDVTVANFRTTPVVDLISGIDSATICGTETLNLNAGNAGAGISYLWSPNNQNTQTITVSSTGDYSVIVSNGNCSDTDKVHVKSVTVPKDVLSDALYALEANYCFAEESQGVNLSAIGIDGKTYHYAWSTGETTAQINIKAAGTYVVNVTEDKCQEADAITIVDYCPTTFFIPDAFSPNYDNKNDVFEIYGSYIPNFEIFIFNRWGEVVYHSTDYLASWNGTYMGDLVQEDVYVVKVRYSINQENGNVQRRERLQKLAVLR